MYRLILLFLLGACLFGNTPVKAAIGDDSSKTPQIEPRASEVVAYAAYEKIVMTPLSDLRDPAVQNWRKLYLAKTEKYEKFLEKYPASVLTAEAKLRIAELWRDVERPEVYAADIRYHQCLGDTAGTEAQKACARFQTEKRRDPVYMKKAADLFIELVRDYSHMRRYALVVPPGQFVKARFGWVDEEIGAMALYWLSTGADPIDQKKILLQIQMNYKMGKRLQAQVEADLKELEQKVY